MWWLVSVSMFFIPSQCFSEGCIEYHSLSKSLRRKKLTFFPFFDTQIGNLKQNYATHVYWTYEPIDAPKMKYKFKILFSILQTFCGVSVWPKDEFEMDASIFRWLWRKIKNQFWSLYEIEGSKWLQNQLQKADLKWVFFQQNFFVRYKI